MPHSKTPGGQQASEKFMKQQAESMSHYHARSFSNSKILTLSFQEHGLGPNDEPQKPGEAPVASDSGRSNVGIDNSATNQPGEKGIGGPEVSSS